MTNWTIAIVVLVVLAVLLVIAGGEIPAGTIWGLTGLLLFILIRSSYRKWNRKNHSDKESESSSHSR